MGFTMTSTLYMFIIYITFILCMIPNTFLALLLNIREGVVRIIPTRTTIRRNLYFLLRTYNY